MRRVPASELERGDWLVCSDGTRVRVANMVQVLERVVLRLSASDSHDLHPPFSVPARTKFMREAA